MLEPVPNETKSIEESEDLPEQLESNAAYIPTAECQFGVAGRSEHVRSLVADGRLRRLPTIVEASQSMHDDQIRTAQGTSSSTPRR
jgi:hypothetical protein